MRRLGRPGLNLKRGTESKGTDPSPYTANRRMGAASGP